MLTRLDASAVRDWCQSALQALTDHQGEIDALNVFPIPDGDTGTNLVLTMQGAAGAVHSRHPPAAGARPLSAAELLRVLAKAATLAARGNSGVILSQVLSGLATGFEVSQPGQAQSAQPGQAQSAQPGQAQSAQAARQLAGALRRASDAAYAAVPDPVEGTILTVARAAATSAERSLSTAAAQPAELADVISAATAGARAALNQTPTQLRALAEAGVVDAGGLGLVLVLGCLEATITGDPAEPAEVLAEAAATGQAGESMLELSGPATVGAALEDHAPRRNPAEPQSIREAGSEEFCYEVQYLLEADEGNAARLKAELAELGDSVLVVNAGDGIHNVHVHVNDVGAAIEAGVAAGRPHRIAVSRFADQVSEAAPGRTGTAVVAVAPGEGLADLFQSEGVVVVDGGPSHSPSTAEVLREIMASGAARVILLPNASAVGGVAEMAAEQARLLGVAVAVIPTKSPIQGLSAVAIHDERRRFEDDVIAMAETAAATRFAEVTIAVREAITYAGRCSAGDVLGLIDGEVVEIGSDVGRVGISLVRRLVAVGGELITVLAGSDAGAGAAAEELSRYVRKNHPLVEFNAFSGGQPHFPLLIGVE
ncbi:MAG: Dak phosphatase [Frankiales bacterium]|nr:Dak phosphatase [Frankiales bacterium]